MNISAFQTPAANIAPPQCGRISPIHLSANEHMTDYAAMTLIPDGHNAFTSTYRPEVEKEHLEAEERRKEHNRTKLAKKRMRINAKRVNRHSDIGRSTGPANSTTAPR